VRGADFVDQDRPGVQTYRLGDEAVGTVIVASLETSGLGEWRGRAQGGEHRSGVGVLHSKDGDLVCKVYKGLEPTDVGGVSGADLPKVEVSTGLQGLLAGGGL
jgi:hypothetical protein